MKLKSYFSGTVEAAMQLARKELGDEALLINARPATAETRGLGAFEVVFGIPPPEPPAAAPARPDRPARTAERHDPGAARDLQDTVADLKSELQRLGDVLAGAALPGTAAMPAPGTLYSRLIEAELDSELARQVTRGSALEDLFSVDPTLGRRGGARAVVALVGPPGAGKTTTLIKLAARYGMSAQANAHILSADVSRIAAADQLCTLAAILGIGCTVTDTPAALVQALEEHRGKDLILIDTPGLAPCDMEEWADLTRQIGGHPEIDVHLVLPCTMRPPDLQHTIRRFEPFHPGKLLFTRIDESSRFGVLVNESARSGRPVSFLSTGQRIPDEIEPASRERVVALVYGQTPAPARSARAAA
jgi:flagellar biosynthesis protein FlhF